MYREDTASSFLFVFKNYGTGCGNVVVVLIIIRVLGGCRNVIGRWHVICALLM